MRFSAIVLLGLAAVAGCYGPKERNWVTMGTTASIKTKRTPDRSLDVGLRLCRELTGEVEKLFNAYDPESALSKSAALSDEELVARFQKQDSKSVLDPCPSECVAAALKLRDLSGGAFNPRWKGPGTLDLGAIAKGYAVDVLVRQVSADDGSQMLIDIGGNLRCRRGKWTVGIAGSDEVIELKDGEACATSAEYFRGKHIYDARTGNAVTNDLLSVTIVHPTSAMLADGLSTICFILGEKEGTAFLQKYYPEARAIWIKK